MLYDLRGPTHGCGYAPGRRCRLPSKRAADLAASLGMEKDRFKPRVRGLKELGLTQSLEVGYRITPRGRVVLKRIFEP